MTDADVPCDEVGAVRQRWSMFTHDNPDFDEKLDTPLLKAVQSGDAALVNECLLWRGPEGQWRDPREQDNLALQVAAEMGHKRVVLELLRWVGPDREWCDPRANNEWALERAAYGSKWGVVLVLVKWRGPGGEFCDLRKFRCLPLRQACITGSAKIVSALLRWRSPDGGAFNVITHATNISAGFLLESRVFGTSSEEKRERERLRRLKIARVLFRWRGPGGQWFDPRVIRNGLLFEALRSNDVRLATEVLAWRGPGGEFCDLRTHWVDSSQKKIHAFEVIVGTGNAALLKVLFEWRGPGGEYYDTTWLLDDNLHLVVLSGSVSMVRMFLKWRGPDGTWNDPRVLFNYALRAALETENLAILKLLLRWRGPNGQWCDPRNLLFSAMISGRTEAVRLLLRWRGRGGERCNPLKRDNVVGLHIVMRKRYAHIVREYLDFRGPSGECYDARELVENVHDQLLVYGNVDMAKVFLEWRGPNGEQCGFAIAQEAFTGTERGEVLDLFRCEEAIRREWRPIRVAWVTAVALSIRRRRRLRVFVA